jgi:hypothetical protein
MMQSRAMVLNRLLRASNFFYVPVENKIRGQTTAPENRSRFHRSLCHFQLGPRFVPPSPRFDHQKSGLPESLLIRQAFVEPLR